MPTRILKGQNKMTAIKVGKIVQIVWVSPGGWLIALDEFGQIWKKGGLANDNVYKWSRVLPPGEGLSNIEL